jgi:hypothetical protein
MTKDTFPSLFTVTAGSLATEGPQDGDAVTVRWCRETGDITFDAVPELDGVAVRGGGALDVINALISAHRIAAELSVMCKVLGSAPDGMELKRIPNAPVRKTYITRADKTMIRKVFKNSSFRDQVIPLGGPMSKLKLFGLFAPGADSSKPGTPHLVPVVKGAYGPHDVGWAVQYVGLPNMSRDEKLKAFVAWTNAEGIAELVSQCAQGDPEYIETLALLSESGDCDNTRAMAEEKRILVDVREKFKARKYRVDVNKAAACALMGANAEVRTRTERGWGFRAGSEQSVNLLPQHGAVLDADARAMNVGVVLSFTLLYPDKDTPRVMDAALATAAAYIEEKGLGHLYASRDSANAARVLVARDDELVKDYLSKIIGFEPTRVRASWEWHGHL